MPSQQSFIALNEEGIQDEQASQNGVEGHLKAKQRLKDHRKQQFKEKNQEVRRLIGFQSTALQAIHLQSIMQPLKIVRAKDPLNKVERERLDKILQDEREWLNVTYQ